MAENFESYKATRTGRKPMGRKSDRMRASNGRSDSRDFKARSEFRGSKRDLKGAGRFDKKRPSKFGGRSPGRPERTRVTCDSCKKQCEVPFKPTSDKPVYCDSCFGKGSKSGGQDLSEINAKLDKIMKALQID